MRLIGRQQQLAKEVVISGYDDDEITYNRWPLMRSEEGISETAVWGKEGNGGGVGYRAHSNFFFY